MLGGNSSEFDDPIDCAPGRACFSSGRSSFDQASLIRSAFVDLTPSHRPAPFATATLRAIITERCDIDRVRKRAADYDAGVEGPANGRGTQMNQKHPDGTRCLEGVRGAPKTFRACCDFFESHLSSCVYDIRYEWHGRSRQWAIPIADGGSSSIAIRYCPHCGTRLRPAGTIKRRRPLRRRPLRT